MPLRLLAAHEARPASPDRTWDDVPGLREFTAGMEPKAKPHEKAAVRTSLDSAKRRIEKLGMGEYEKLDIL